MENCTCKRPDLHMLDDALYCQSCGYYATQKNLMNSYHRANYHYNSLQSSRSIRLVRLRGGHRAQAIECDIFHTTLGAHEKFEALSYTWGDSTAIRQIETPKGPLSVTVNCFAALEDLRFEDRDRTLWIDAICINQRSNSEKNHQVPLMSQIYAAASQVLIYIGRDPRPEHPEQFFAFWRGNGIGLHVSQHDISKFLSFPWWSRVWILQEVAVARRATLVWCSATLEWGLFSVAHVITRGFEPIDLDGNVPPVFMFSGNDPKPLNDIYSLMHTARISQCSEPRDKIYALVGLLGDHVVHNLVADYGISLQALYVNFAMHLIRSYRNLDVLSFLGRETILESAEDEMTRLGHFTKQMRTYRDRITKLDSEKKTLEKATTSIEIPFQSPRTDLPSWVPQLDFLPLLNTMTDLYSGPRSSYTPSLCTGEHAVPALKIRIFTVDSVRPYEASSHAVDDHHTEPCFPQSIIPYIYGYVNNFAKGRKVMFTSESWIICSHEVQGGDQVCFIDSTRMPFVLRLVGQNEHCRSFRLLGECYIRAVGDCYSDFSKEASQMKQSEEGNSPWEDVCLV